MENVRVRLKALEDGINANIEIEVFEDENDLTRTGQIIRDVLTTQGDEVDIFLTQTGSAAVIAQTLGRRGFRPHTGCRYQRLRGDPRVGP